MRRARTIFLVAAILLAVLPALATADAIRVAESCEVDADQVTFGNLVVPSSREAVPGGLESVVICAAPNMGRTLRISGDVVRSRLERAHAVPEDLVIPGQIEIRRASQTVEPSRIRRAVTEYVAGNNPWPRFRHEVEFMGTIRPMAVRTGTIEIHVEPNAGSDLAGRVSFRVAAVVDGEVAARAWVSVRVHVFAQGFQLATNVRRYHRLGELDLVPIEVDLAVSGDAVLDREAVLGLRTRQAIRTGSVLVRRMVELPPLVRRGDVVTISLSGRGIIIKTIGKVAEDGNLGEMVRVLNLQTRRTVYARVVDENTVIVDF